MRRVQKYVPNMFALLLLTFLMLSPHSALALEKPRVAILQAKISDKISKNARKYLNVEKLQSEMEASFLAARKFDVLTRKKESLGVILDEQEFANSSFSAGDAAESGQLQNADYLIRPEISIFSFYSSFRNWDSTFMVVRYYK